MDVLFTAPAIRLIAQGHGPSQCVPWHSHDNISDAFFCLSGRLRIATRAPDRIVLLDPGDSHTVPPGVAHFVSGEAGRPCEMLIVQGVGAYNYVAE
ncbi:hypothetical protein CAL12_21615 [Bordetella genomosp. 8]|uniref:Cupin type-2 domain-containing protein n=2 Tax=Bordetella genomosp. 8 TaxID=1416806 RepID=A0A1W6YUB3_9BORD|nr:hypothetical protein CAL12_21615 [Bordetella genomosp. 8]